MGKKVESYGQFMLRKIVTAAGAAVVGAFILYGVLTSPSNKTTIFSKDDITVNFYWVKDFFTDRIFADVEVENQSSSLFKGLSMSCNLINIETKKTDKVIKHTLELEVAPNTTEKLSRFYFGERPNKHIKNIQCKVDALSF